MFSFLVALMLAAAPADGGVALLAPLIGHWVGDGSGSPGTGPGEFSFEPGLQGKVVLRKNSPSTRGRRSPAFRHDDLMVVYQEGGQGPLRADYYDNEGHVIRYTVSAEGKTIRFLGDVDGGGAAIPAYLYTHRFRHRSHPVRDGAARPAGGVPSVYRGHGAARSSRLGGIAAAENDGERAPQDDRPQAQRIVADQKEIPAGASAGS
ncbi:MAG: hypothetical protein QM757_33720 [Paludibaculum sp.]